MGNLLKSLIAMSGKANTHLGLGATGAALLLFGAASRSDAAVQLFWADWGNSANLGDRTDDSIRTINSDGTGALTLVTTQRPIGVAVDAANQQVYYATGGSGVQGIIGRVNFNGSGNTTLVQTADLGPDADAQGIKLDLTHGKIYWTSYAQGVRRANLDGSNVEVVEAAGDTGDSRLGLTLDVANNKIYVNSPSSQNVYQSALAAPGSFTALPLLTTGANDLAINAAGTTFYYPDSSGSIKSINADGTNPQTLVSGLGLALGVALSADGKTIYWAERSTSRIGFDDTDPATPQNPTFIATGAGFGIAEVDAVPEPGALSLLVLAGGALFVRRRRTEA